MPTDTKPHTVTVRAISASSHEVTCSRCGVIAAGIAIPAAAEAEAYWHRVRQIHVVSVSFSEAEWDRLCSRARLARRSPHDLVHDQALREAS